MFDSIIFDLDGTLWDSTVPICESWNVVLKRHAEIKRPPVTINELGECMGLPMYDIAAKLFPLESKEVQTAIMDELCAYENEYLSEHGARLFDGLENVLSLLSKRYRLFIVSNCQDGYIEAFLKAHRLAKYFADGSILTVTDFKRKSSAGSLCFFMAIHFNLGSRIRLLSTKIFPLTKFVV